MTSQEDSNSSIEELEVDLDESEIQNFTQSINNLLKKNYTGDECHYKNKIEMFKFVENSSIDNEEHAKFVESLNSNNNKLESMKSDRMPFADTDNIVQEKNDKKRGPFYSNLQKNNNNKLKESVIENYFKTPHPRQNKEHAEDYNNTNDRKNDTGGISSDSGIKKSINQIRSDLSPDYVNRSSKRSNLNGFPLIGANTRITLLNPPEITTKTTTREGKGENSIIFKNQYSINNNNNINNIDEMNKDNDCNSKNKNLYNNNSLNNDSINHQIISNSSKKSIFKNNTPSPFSSVRDPPRFFSINNSSLSVNNGLNLAKNDIFLVNSNNCNDDSSDSLLAKDESSYSKYVNCFESRSKFSKKDSNSAAGRSLKIISNNSNSNNITNKDYSKISNFNSKFTPFNPVSGGINGNAPSSILNSYSRQKPLEIHQTPSYQHLSLQQQDIIKTALAGKSFFFTGAAGTGKSYVLAELIYQFRENYKEAGAIQVTAPTGIAAIPLNGTTIHSFSGIGLGQGTTDFLVNKIRQNRNAQKRWREVKTLIIDEISMLSLELFDKLEEIARKIRKCELPFGGIQVIFCGDFFQLPPVVPKSCSDDLIYCFQSKKWPEVVPNTFVLDQIYRQAGDEKFICILTEIRQASLSDKSFQLLASCVERKWDDGLEPTRLFPLKRQVALQNSSRLAKLEGKEYVYNAKDIGDALHAKQLSDCCPASQKLVLKKGAHVFLLKNLDLEAELVNGTRGIVTDFVKHEKGIYPLVLFENNIERVIETATWDLTQEHKVLASRVQVPLDLAWALSIHKSQGMTLSRVELSLENIFEYGQAYVALSRAKSLSGIRIIDGITQKSIRSHPEVIKFYSRITRKYKQ